MHVLTTAGPTREPLDAVRFLSNRSSGTLGTAVANAAARAGHTATLLLGPVTRVVDPHPAVTLVRFETTDDLRYALEKHFPAADVLIMAAAVGDYALAGPLPGKTERKDDLTLKLTATPDLVAGVAQTKRPDQTVIAFALEEDARLEPRAAAKMKRKGVDAIVANPLSTMNAADIDAVLLTAAGRREQPGPMPKPDFAAWLIDQLPRINPATD